MKFNTCPIKRASSFLLVLLVVFTFTPYSYAENITPNANKDETKKKVQETKETWQQKKLETRVKVIEKVKFHGSIMIKRYEAAVSRFENIILRIEKRVESARSGGIDTSKIETSLSAVKAKIESTKSSLALARSSIESISPQGDENQIKSGANLFNRMKKLPEITKTLQSWEGESNSPFGLCRPAHGRSAIPAASLTLLSKAL